MSGEYDDQSAIKEVKDRIILLDKRVSAIAGNAHVSQICLQEISKNVRVMRVGVIWWQQATLLVVIGLLAAILWRVW
jgi:hypothetical protein